MSDLINSVAKAMSDFNATSNNFTAQPVVEQPKAEEPETAPKDSQDKE